MRSLATAAFLVAAYYLLPMDSAFTATTVLMLLGGIAAVTGLLAWQIYQITLAPRPGLKAMEAMAINGSRELLEWWLQGPRWEFDDHLDEPGAPLFPSERRDPGGRCKRVGTSAIRGAMAEAVQCHLPRWVGRATPHALRHFAASDLYAQGMNVVAVQELLGHRWINTTMIYVHVNKTHIEDAWISAGQRVASRFTG